MKKSVKLLMSVSLAMVLLSSVLSGCGAKKSSNESDTKATASKPKTVKYLSMWAENVDSSKLIIDLSNQYAKENPGFKMEFEMVPSTNLVQKVRTLIASNDVPELFATGGSISDLVDTGYLMNIETEFNKLGIMNIFEDSAVAFNKLNAGGKGLYTLPMGMNIEGIWYNKKIFKDNNLEVPKTWEEFMNVCQKLTDKGVQPISVGGKDRWPLTRFINMYIIRSMGPDALKDAKDGKLQFTDAGFAKAADVIKDMSNKGYFGKGINTIDNSTAESMFLTGKTAMINDGSWVVSTLNDTTKNTLGDTGVGYFNYPTVEGGKSSGDNYILNTGNGLAINPKKYDDDVAKWIKYVFTKIGDKSINEYGTLKGYKVSKMPDKMPVYTKLLNEEMLKIKTTSTWFEFGFDDKTTQTILNNGQLLLLPDSRMTSNDFFKQIDTSYSEYKKSKK